VKAKEIVLFVPLGKYAFDQQLATALYLASQSECRPHFLLISKDDHTFVEQLESAGISFNTLDPLRGTTTVPGESSNNGNGDAPTPNSGSLKTGVRGFTRWLPGISLVRFFFLAWRLWLKKSAAKTLVQRLSPRCAVVSQERLHLFFPILKPLREFKVPIILMLAAESSPDGGAWLRRESHLLKAGLNKSSASPKNSPYRFLVTSGIAVLNRAVQRWLPSQVYDSRWGKMLFYPAGQIFLLKMMGMLPQNPWYQGTTFTDYIMISGIDESAMYAEARVDPAKLLFLGSHELDVLHECWLARAEIREQLSDRYRLDRDKSIAIITLPTLWEQGMISEEAYWQSVNDILGVLTQQDCNVLISLHPRSNLSHYRWIEEKYPVKISKEPLKDILVIADIFVATYSSTIRWAIALGIPVINLDFWQFNKIYRNLTGYQTVTTLPEFDDLAKQLALTPKRDGLNGGLNPITGETGILVDGKAKERLVRFIESLESDTATPAVPSEHTAAVL